MISMVSSYIVDFYMSGTDRISVIIRAENSELALNQAVGSLSSEWVSFVDIDNNPIRVKSSKVSHVVCIKTED